MSDYYKSKEELAKSQKKVNDAMGSKQSVGEGASKAWANLKSAFSGDQFDKALKDRQKKTAGGN